MEGYKFSVNLTANGKKNKAEYLVCAKDLAQAQIILAKNLAVDYAGAEIPTINSIDWKKLTE